MSHLDDSPGASPLYSTSCKLNKMETTKGEIARTIPLMSSSSVYIQEKGTKRELLLKYNFYLKIACQEHYTCFNI